MQLFNDPCYSLLKFETYFWASWRLRIDAVNQQQLHSNFSLQRILQTGSRNIAKLLTLNWIMQSLQAPWRWPQEKCSSYAVSLSTWGSTCPRLHLRHTFVSASSGGTPSEWLQWKDLAGSSIFNWQSWQRNFQKDSSFPLSWRVLV